MLFLLPESVRHMVTRGAAPQRIRAVLLKISSSLGDATEFVLGEKVRAVSQNDHGKRGVALVLSRSYVVGSAMLWLTYGMGIVIFYALINWMPILLKDAGIDPKTALLVTSLFPLGGVGAIAFGFLMDRFNANRVIMLGYLATAVFVYMIGQAAGNIGWLVVTVFVGGAVMNTTQTSMPALAANFYPTAGRATGVAWMMAIGRIGAVAAPFLVAELQRRQFSFDQIFAVLAIPGVIAAMALFVKNASHPEEKESAAKPVAVQANKS
jgi:AAHS family 4-hydroxybenzoate transporter-like MFS transporter